MTASAQLGARRGPLTDTGPACIDTHISLGTAAAGRQAIRLGDVDRD